MNHADAIKVAIEACRLRTEYSNRRYLEAAALLERPAPAPRKEPK